MCLTYVLKICVFDLCSKTHVFDLCVRDVCLTRTWPSQRTLTRVQRPRLSNQPVRGAFQLTCGATPSHMQNDKRSQRCVRKLKFGFEPRIILVWIIMSWIILDTCRNVDWPSQTGVTWPQTWALASFWLWRISSTGYAL